MTMQFRKAEKKRGRLRVALAGVSGSGKTYTLLQMATRVAERVGTRVAFIDTEAGSSELYADAFDFDVLHLDPPFAPARYREALQAAADSGHGVVVVDSLSHAWMGEGGALEMVDDAAKRKQGNKYAAWGDVTPEHHRLVEAMIRFPGHLFASMRSKADYVEETDGKGKKSYRKVGMAPLQRDGMEYEFTVVADLDLDHNWITSKTRCNALDEAVFNLVSERSGGKVADLLLDWIESGASPEDAFMAHAKELGVTDEELSAFATLHPDLPDSILSWSEPHYEVASRVLAKHGRAKFTSALEALKARSVS